MKAPSTPLTELRINTYEDPLLQHQYVCLGHKIANIRILFEQARMRYRHIRHVFRDPI